MTFNIKEELAPLLAEARCKFGIVPSMSTGICGFITVGYGKLDDNGYWEYPLQYDLWPDSYKDLYNQLY